MVWVWLIGPGPADGTPGEPSGCTEMSHATRGKGEIKQSRPLQLVPHLTNLYILRRMRQVSSMLKGGTNMFRMALQIFKGSWKSTVH